MSDTTSEYAELLESLDPDWWEPDHSVHHSVAKTMREAADAIRALEAKVREAEHWNESCEAENRKHILSLREHAQRLEDDRDRLAAEVAALRADAERYRWLRAHMTWYVDYEADGDAFVPFHRWYWNASPVVLELDAAIDAARGAGEKP